MSFLFFLLFVQSFCFISTNISFEPDKSIVWGPGLKNVALPARYFFVQLVNNKGVNLTESIGENPFRVKLQLIDGSKVRVSINTLDRNDGSYIIRYKLYDSYRNLKLYIQYQGDHVGKSPYALDGANHPEECHCPLSYIRTWRNLMNCPSTYQQIDDDLSPFKKIDSRWVVKEAIKKFSDAGSHSIVHYVLKNNKIFRKTYGKHVGFKMFSDAILLSLSRKVYLPDMEFVVNLGDWPLSKMNNKEPIPIISWCGSDDTYDIIIPTYDLTEATLQTMSRVGLEQMSVQSNTGPKWENKSSIAFWRGRDSRKERLKLVKLSMENPEILDAALTAMFFFKHDKTEHGEIKKRVPFFDFFKSKYLINVDGTVAAYRLPYLLLGDSAIFKHESVYYEHFYKKLKPNIHYIPFKQDMSDIIDQIKWAQSNEQQVKKIIKNAQEFARENLMPTDVFCYHLILLQKLAKRSSPVSSVPNDMEEVNYERPKTIGCKCDERKNRDEL